MKYFLDSAKLDEIKFAYNTFGIDGVTTNPKHVMHSGKSFYAFLRDISEWVKEEKIEGKEVFPISVEINPNFTVASEMIEMGEEVSKISSNFVIKIPCTEAGIEAARKLEKMDIRTNLTLVFSSAQAIIAGKNHSMYVSPFIGWKESNGEDCKKFIEDISKIYDNYGYKGKTEIICAAIRTPKQMVDCALAGADIVTAGIQVYQDSFRHPFTTQGLGIFSDAWNNTISD